MDHGDGAKSRAIILEEKMEMTAVEVRKGRKNKSNLIKRFNTCGLPHGRVYTEPSKLYFGSPGPPMAWQSSLIRPHPFAS